MKKIYTLALATLMFCGYNASAQNKEQRLTPEVMAKLFPTPVVSPDYNKDGSVTFRYKSEVAKTVQLDCQMFSEKKDMVKDDKNVWSITVTPQVPDIYPYCFIVDGKQVADPANMFIFPNEGFKNSLCDVRGDAPTMQDLQNVPHGKVSYRYYNSTTYGFVRPMCVYTPAGYDPAGSETYPVLYLIHGMTDTYETWFKVGRMNNIMDNLIAQGLANKMIVVMPYANAVPEMQNRKIKGDFNVLGTDNFVKEIINDVIPFIEKNYKTKTDADNRAIAGFSLGGRQTLATGFGNPDVFHWVAAFAPAIFGGEWEKNFETGVYADVNVLKEKLKYMRLCCGTEDFLVESSRGLDKTLTDKGLKHVTYFPGGGHTWMNCRDYLELTVKDLFK